jgi:hypothetical protein
MFRVVSFEERGLQLLVIWLKAKKLTWVNLALDQGQPTLGPPALHLPWMNIPLLASQIFLEQIIRPAKSFMSWFLARQDFLLYLKFGSLP